MWQEHSTPKLQISNQLLSGKAKPCAVDEIDRIPTTVGIPIISISDRVFLCESALRRIIIPCPQIDGLVLFIVVFPAVSKRVVIPSRFVILNTKSVVKVSLSFSFV